MVTQASTPRRPAPVRLSVLAVALLSLIITIPTSAFPILSSDLVGTWRLTTVSMVAMQTVFRVESRDLWYTVLPLPFPPGDSRASYYDVGQAELIAEIECVDEELAIVTYQDGTKRRGFWGIEHGSQIEDLFDNIVTVDFRGGGRLRLSIYRENYLDLAHLVGCYGVDVESRKTVYVLANISEVTDAR